MQQVLVENHSYYSDVLVLEGGFGLGLADFKSGSHETTVGADRDSS